MQRWWRGAARGPTLYTTDRPSATDTLPRAPTRTVTFSQKVRRYSERASEQMWPVQGCSSILQPAREANAPKAIQQQLAGDGTGSSFVL